MRRIDRIKRAIAQQEANGDQGPGLDDTETALVLRILHCHDGERLYPRHHIVALGLALAVLSDREAV